MNDYLHHGAAAPGLAAPNAALKGEGPAVASSGSSGDQDFGFNDSASAAPAVQGAGADERWSPKDEALIVWVAAANTRIGVQLTDEDFNRLTLATRRLRGYILDEAL